MKKHLFCLIALTVCASFTTNAFAQEQFTKEKLNRIVPVSPNVASLGIFGNIPIGHHTGVPQISVPIHEIDFHGLKIPIELSYHASGIKVAQEASSVGLGWALNAGGCITRNILHQDDFEIYCGHYTSTKAQPPIAHEISFDIRDYLPFMGFNGSYDSEPDFFSYSFCSHSGSFFLKPRAESNGIASLMGVENTVQIKYIEGANKWEAIDAYGFTYIFGSSEDTRETTRTYSGHGSATNVSSIIRSRFTPQGLFPTVTAWYLETIRSPLNDAIQFKYRKERLLSLYQFSEDKYFKLIIDKSIKLSDEYDYSYASYSNNEQLLLSSIEYDGGSIEFEYESRSDLQLHNINNVAKKLTSISVYENLTRDNYSGKKRVKHCTLAHSYMGGYSTNHETLRLMLDEVCFRSVDSSNTDVKKYQFTYNSGILPSKYSQDVDYWGYYNGNGFFTQGTRGQTEISPFINIGADYMWEMVSFGGRNRTPNENCAKYGTLSSMKYPTGGKTVFDFELNDFTDKIQVGTTSGNVDLSCGGGLRVKQIIDYSNDTDIVSIRRFVYQKNGVSSGRLKIVPVHHQTITVDNYLVAGSLAYISNMHVVYFNIQSEGISSSILNSGNVGYSYVEEHNVTENKNNGYTAYHFVNHTASARIGGGG